MLTLVAFVLALGLLIAVHEYGHYRMAVACGVKVLRFSIGFGRTLLRWQPRGSATEFVICAFPLGGYVRMLDEREAPVHAQERHLAFNTQPLRSRALIVAAGPVANLLLAVLLYAVVNWSGVQLPAAVLGSPVAGSVAEHAGVQAGDRVARAAFAADELQAVDSFEDVRWWLTRGALENRDVRLALTNGTGAERELVLPLAQMGAQEADANLFRRIGIVAPFGRAVIGEVMPGGAAERAGLRQGDVVLRMGAQTVQDGAQLRDLIRASVQGGETVAASWRILRDGQELALLVRPEVRQEGDQQVGRIGAFVGAAPEFVIVRHGPLDGLWQGVVRTWEVSALTLRMMGRMLIGEASLKNLSGPLTIADYAGRSASLGLTQYLTFLALISVSLGVLNLLPLPVLDGGHLMYYVWEGLIGRNISELWLDRLQRGGIAILAVMMTIALFNDLARLWG
ncbi:MAG: RIP metalloprotease RseP [Curvibacter sp. GWA2_64_110]|nr:MAG: RIP metalloprotease RseP [Curvibacter sp. GWA2_64_110]HCY14571.1 RIP metalloprotease RseP [Curvibacter sp.]